MNASRDATSPLMLEHFVAGMDSEEGTNCDIVGPTGVMLESQSMYVNPNGIELSTSMKTTEGKGGQVALLTTRITSDKIEMRLATKGSGKGQGIFWGNLPNGGSRKRKIDNDCNDDVFAIREGREIWCRIMGFLPPSPCARCNGVARCSRLSNTYWRRVIRRFQIECMRRLHAHCEEGLCEMLGVDDMMDLVSVSLG